MKKSGLLYSILTIIICLVLTITAPDLIFHIRVLLSMLSPSFFLTLSTNTIDASNYISIIVSILSCLLSAMLTFAAYKISRTLGNQEIGSQRAKEMQWATKVYSYFQWNFKIIYKKHKNVGDLSRFDRQRKCQDDIISLYSANLINYEERELLEECMKCFIAISNMLSSQNESGVDEIIAQLVMNHIDISDTDFSFKQKTKVLMDKLEGISKNKEVHINATAS